MRKITNYFKSHFWLAPQTRSQFFIGLAIIAITYASLPYAVYRQPGVVEMMVNTLNLVPLINLDYIKTYSWTQTFLGWTFNIFLVIFFVWLVYFIIRVIYDVVKGKPKPSKDDTQDINSPSSVKLDLTGDISQMNTEQLSITEKLVDKLQDIQSNGKKNEQKSRQPKTETKGEQSGDKSSREK